MALDCTLDLLAPILQLAGVALGGLIGFLSARHISNRNARLAAAALLRTAFAPTQVAIHKARAGKREGVGELIEREVQHLACAVEEFRVYVPESESDAYQLAWEKYEEAAVLGEFLPKDDPFRELERLLAVLLSYASPRRAQ